jgi:hypothetical protein
MPAHFSKEDIKQKADRAEARSRDEGAVKESAPALSESERNAEIAIGQASAGVYESSRVKEAKRLGVRVGWLDDAVDKKRDKGKGKEVDTDFLPHWKVEPWPGPVDGAALLSELREPFLRYAVMAKHADVVLALWPLHTWVYDCFDITPYLAITSPTRRCGKSLVLTILHWLCCRAKKNDSMSQATIYRSVDVEKPTLLLDECSWVKDLKESAKIFYVADLNCTAMPNANAKTPISRYVDIRRSAPRPSVSSVSLLLR